MSTSKRSKQTVPSGGASVNSQSKRGGLGVANQPSVNKSKMGAPRGSIVGASRAGLSSASRRSAGGPSSEKSTHPPHRAPVQIFDENGCDVTPLPLLTVDPSAVKKGQGNLLGDSSGGTPTDLMSQNSMSMYQGTVTASAFGGGPFSRSVFSQSYETGTESVDDMDTTGADQGLAWAEIRHKREEVKEVLTEADLEKIVDITLSESDTIWLLDMAGVCVNVESDEANAIKDRNDKYAELVKTRVGNDLYMERGMNTFNEPPKYKIVQTNKITYADVGINASTWDMYDTYQSQEKTKKGSEEEGEEEEGTISRPATPKGEAPEPDKESSGDASLSRVNSSRVGSAAAVDSSRLSEGASDTSSKERESRATMASSQAGTDSVFVTVKEVATASSVGSDAQAAQTERILKLDSLKNDFFVMERAVNLNTYQPKQALYRGLSIVQDIDREKAELSQFKMPDMGPSMDRLWAYTCPLTKGRNVSCIAWNRANPDLVAVGYGQFEFTSQKPGLICCWSLKNPEFPERIYTTRQGVTSLDFANKNNNLLAAGLYDGGVVIFNVRNAEDEPVLDNFESAGKHSGPIWQIKWIEKEKGTGDEKAEVIVTISTDGRVTQWSIRKGFESHDLMRLKRMPTRMSVRGRERKGEAFISRFAGGLCFDFVQDSNIYLAGTEEGHIHKCSCSYNEQYLESYTGHTGPVYRIEWSPFLPDVFLSCGADWTVRLWDQERTAPVLSFYSSTKAVHDLSWSPRSSTVFACVNEGAIEVWDLASSTLDPVINYNSPQAAKQTAVAFSHNSECILVGDSEGSVTVFQLRSMLPPSEMQAETLSKIIKATLASQLQGTSAVNLTQTSQTEGNNTEFEAEQ